MNATDPIKSLDRAAAALTTATSAMQSSGRWRNPEGYLADTELWVERASCGMEADWRARRRFLVTSRSRARR